MPQSEFHRAGEFDFSSPLPPFPSLSECQKDIMLLSLRHGSLQNVVQEAHGLGNLLNIPLETAIPAQSLMATARARQKNRRPYNRRTPTTKTRAGPSKTWITRNAVKAFKALNPGVLHADALAAIRQMQANGQDLPQMPPNVEAESNVVQLPRGKRGWQTQIRKEIERAKREDGETITDKEAHDRLVAHRRSGRKKVAKRPAIRRGRAATGTRRKVTRRAATRTTRKARRRKAA